MQETLAIKKEFYESFVSPNGLALLGRGHGENDNGILFLAIFLMLVKEANEITQSDLDKTFLTLKSIEVQPGLYKRTPTSQSYEAHDNYIGICALSVLFNFKNAREIVEFGTAHGFAYDNKTPESPRKESIRQGGDIAVYKVSAGFAPTLWELCWLIFGIISAGLKGTPSVVNLTWLRLKTLALALKDKSGASLFTPTVMGVFVASLIFNIAIRKRYGGIQGSFAGYFSEDHPIRRIAKELEL